MRTVINSLSPRRNSGFLGLIPKSVVQHKSAGTYIPAITETESEQEEVETEDDHKQPSLVNDVQNEVEDRSEEGEIREEELGKRRYGKGKIYARRLTSRGPKDQLLKQKTKLKWQL